MATAEIETVTSPADKFKLALASLLALAGLVGFFVFKSSSAADGWLQWGILLAAWALALVFFFISHHGRVLFGFGGESWREVQKVVWPTRKESTQMTIYVFVFVFIMALFLWLTDKSLEWALYDLILGWRK